jgi:type I restriction-modification system DNA methylase subunit/restriction endonuclease S subunit
MICKDTFKKLLTKLEFTEHKDVYTKQFNNFELKADFKKEELIYPSELTINEKQTCNFSSNENSVVFECVHRLFEKGYHPKHIELEPKWKLGHGAKGGRADILVKDNDGKSLLIIECKTAGKEYDDAWKDTLEDGGQLFSYFQQEKSTQFLALYTSGYSDSEIKFDYKVIAVLDNEEYLKSFGKREVPSFKNSDTVKKIYQAWVETYQKDFATKGIFEKDIPAYHIGKIKYSTVDLKEVDNESIQKKYHEFASILRQHNVSGHENAFDKLVNLFLAKIVDETNNKNELAFYWKGAAYDDVKSLIDRLQKNYKIGMEKFLKEDVTYIDKKQIDDAFKFFKNKPDATKAKILEYFDQLKYYTNNDFAFIDVHNEKLFYQNSIVLLKIVQMLQDIKLQTETQNQFLGDLFEGFLDKGVKQSEGQFFTPMPIVKFLISSLPLENLICESSEIPKVIDYACGAGHFLNEYAHQIIPYIKSENKEIYFENIVGIEKEYRLSKVAKVSAFMYGQNNIEIVYADALAKNKNIKDGSYSVLIANPPYSVKGFLETLDDESLEKFELFEAVDEKQKKTNNSIECFFIERAKQLLAPNGVAAIVLPSSVLSNGNIYIKMREILLKYFDLVAIAEFGSGTFGKTGTSTATLFLRRKDDNPDISEHYNNRVQEWFSNNFEADKIFEDKILLEKYCIKINIDYAYFSTLLTGTPCKKLLDEDIFKEYRKVFENSTDYKNIQKKKLTDKYKQTHKDQEKQKAFLEYVQVIEKDKLYYFMLAESNPQPVCLVKSPTENKAIKTFLGYEWSTAKGNEGIKYLNATLTDEEDNITVNKGINSMNSPLFNPKNLNDFSKINSLIRNNFTKTNGKNTQPDFVSYARLSELLDFSRVSFDKAFKTTSEKKIEIVSKYPIIKLVEFCGDQNIKKGKSITQKDTKKGNYKVVAGGIDFAYLHNEYNREENTITISASGANAGYVNFWQEKIFASDCTTIRGNSDLESKFLFNYLKIIQDEIYSLAKGQAQPHVYPEDIKTLPIPKIDSNLQKQIINECEKIDDKNKIAQITIDKFKKQISDLIHKVNSGKSKLGDIGDVKMCKRIFKNETTNSGEIPFYKIGTFGKEADAYISMRKFNEFKSKYPFPKIGDVLISAAGTIGKTVVYDGKPAYFQDSNIVWIDNNESRVTNAFLNYVLQIANWTSVLTNGGIISRLYNENLKNLLIPVPSISEQKKIVKEIEGYEIKISEAEEIVKSSSDKKIKIFEKYLN